MQMKFKSIFLSSIHYTDDGFCTCTAIWVQIQIYLRSPVIDLDLGDGLETIVVMLSDARVKQVL